MNALSGILRTQPGGQYGWFDVTDAAMEPTLRRGYRLIVDFFMDRFVGDGLYMIARPGGITMPRRLQGLFGTGGGLRVICDNAKLYGGPQCVPEARLGELLIAGRVVAMIRPV